MASEPKFTIGDLVRVAEGHPYRFFNWPGGAETYATFLCVDTHDDNRYQLIWPNGQQLGIPRSFVTQIQNPIDLQEQVNALTEALTLAQKAIQSIDASTSPATKAPEVRFRHEASPEMKPAPGFSGYPFTIKINDTYCEWEFNLPVDGERSINDLLHTFCEALGVKAPEGQLVKTEK